MAVSPIPIATDSLHKFRTTLGLVMIIFGFGFIVLFGTRVVWGQYEALSRNQAELKADIEDIKATVHELDQHPERIAQSDSLLKSQTQLLNRKGILLDNDLHMIRVVMIVWWIVVVFSFGLVAWGIFLMHSGFSRWQEEQDNLDLRRDLAQAKAGLIGHGFSEQNASEAIQALEGWVEHPVQPAKPTEPEEK